MVHEPVAYRRFIDIPPLRIGYREMAVAAVPVRPCAELRIQGYQIIHEA